MDQKLTITNSHTVAVMPADIQQFGFIYNETVLFVIFLISAIVLYLPSVGLTLPVLSLVLLINVGIISGLILLLINR